MLKATSMALALVCAAGLAQAQTGPNGDLSKFSAGRDLAPNAATFGAAQAGLPDTDSKFRMAAPTATAATPGTPSMAMNSGMSAPQGGALPGLAPQLSDNTFGSKDADGNGQPDVSAAHVSQASAGILGIENSSAAGNLSAATFGVNNVKLGAK